MLYLTGWIEFGVVLGLIVPASSGLKRPEAVAVVVPMMLVIGIVCLAPWYICRSVPLRGIGLISVLRHHILGAVIATVIALVALLRSWGYRPGIVSRGHGRADASALLLDSTTPPETATPAAYGDGGALYGG